MDMVPADGLRTGRTDAKEEEGEQRDGMTTQSPAQRTRRRLLLCVLHGLLVPYACVVLGETDRDV
jgi:hypothetical protein